LPLNKLLCGIAYDDIITRDYQFVTPTASHSTTNTLQGPDTDQQKAQVLPAPPSSPAQHNKQSPEATHQASTPAPKQSQSALGQLKQNCRHILEIAIQQWKGLKRLEKVEEYSKGFTPEDLQTYFLQRSSLLRKIQGATKSSSYWHLTIPVYEHDSKRILPSWSIKRLRLPWMKEDLVVFWLME
ncbi:MAG: hypothetical protein AAFQ08_03860, partial [Bacteroidota bacterium]